MKKDKKFNHAFEIAFSVSGSKYEDWSDCLEKEKELIIHSIWERVLTLFSSDGEYIEAITGFDTYEEDVEEDIYEDDTTEELDERANLRKDRR